MSTALFCTVESAEHAEALVTRLMRAGFSDADISVLFADPEAPIGPLIETHTKAPDTALSGAGTGGLVGGAIGWLASLGSLSIPGAGMFIAAGPIVTALSAAAVGAAIGGIAGALVGMGIPEYEAKMFESKVTQGGILVSVYADTAVECDRAQRILERTGAQDICRSEEELA